MARTQQANRTQDLINTTAHRLRTPLTSAVLRLSRLRRTLDGRLTEEERETFRAVERHLEDLDVEVVRLARETAADREPPLL